ncbi:hypothetical protein K491DRAFT_691760 [Lophiostoma macrostomum CBS 122681]|uniref:Zn(2)-C6 fungal-type domain-containing protein n=1 Tax=Lophiostoma macrostomum CBS 122681 TaxID=1314788 RepID=A0A6A6TA84_9PLEO|nr:hypothetical protein K491DRAFT_691760 [Lophiostoma macrostomum CBS 122681]
MATGIDGYDPVDQEEAIFSNSPVQLSRGRQAKDPNGRTVTFSVSSLEEFETSLRSYLRDPPDEPEHTECQLSFWMGASFLVALPQSVANAQKQQQQQQQQQSHAPQAGPSHQPRAAHSTAPPGYQPANSLHGQYGAPSHASHPYHSVSDPTIALTLPYHASAVNANGAAANGSSNNSSNSAKEKPKTSMSILEALAPTLDPKDKMRKQRAIAKCCVDAIQKTDGYRYSFHNCWNSREDDSFRFSYYCNDSLLNKDRAANGKGAKFGKRATKPVYDCKGVLSVKFSASKQSLDVFYKHVPVHKTYEERAPPPRKDSKRRKFLEENDPEALIRIANRPRPAKPPPEENSVDPNAPPKPKKKKLKKDEEPKSATNSIESDLRAQSLRSLLELIQTDPEPTPQPAQPVQEKVQIPRAPTAPVVDERPAQQAPSQPQPSRKRPRNSCDVCKAKKTKCDGARPVCKTCADKKRQCLYQDQQVEDQRPSISSASQPPLHSDTIRQVQAANQELSELEKMKKELEEARARIQQLESEKTRPSSTPSQPSRTPHSRTQSQSHVSHQAPPQPQPSPQPTPQQQIQNAQLQGAHQMPNPQYNHFANHTNHASYGVNRPIDYGKSAPHPSPTQATHQMQAPSTGLTPTQDANNPYSREFAWPGPFYGYQNAQQHPQDQWTAGRNTGVFR